MEEGGRRRLDKFGDTAGFGADGSMYHRQYTALRVRRRELEKLKENKELGKGENEILVIFK